MKSVRRLSAELNRAGCLPVLLLATSQCTVVVDADRKQCNSNSDCVRLGGASSDIICQDSVCVVKPNLARPPPFPCSVATPTGAGPFTVRLPLIDVMTLTGVSGLAAQICRKIDVDCLNPLGEPVVSDANGTLTITVEAQFDGYLRLSLGNGLPSYYFFNPPVTSDGELPPIRLASPVMVEKLMGSVGRTVDPTRGFVVLTAEDCVGQPAAGVSYSSPNVDAETQTFYSVAHLPYIGPDATDESGYGGLIGVVPGNVSIIGVHQGHGQIGEVSLFVKAPSVSFSRMVPNAKR